MVVKQIKQVLNFCFGISSECQDGLNVIFYDADCKLNTINLNKVKADLIYIQKQFGLSDFYILKSTNGYNAFCIDKLELDEIQDILKLCKMIDKDFIKYGHKRKYYTLRIDKDKELVEIVKNTNNTRIKSFAHEICFENIFNIVMIYPNGYFDNFVKFDIIQYPSEKNGYYKEQKEVDE